MMHPATTPNGAAMVVLTTEEYETLTATRSDVIDGALAAAARAADAGLPTLPADLAKAVLDGETHPLTAWRKASGLSMADLAARANLRPASVSDIENGKIDPRYSTVKALAEALGLDTGDIMP